MAHPLSFLKGVCFGAGAMYFLDPDRGRRRRSLVRDQVVHYRHKANRAAEIVRKDAGNRLYGTLAELRGALRHDQPSDETLVARVRAEIGHHVSHAAAIDVDAANGRIALFGSIPAREVDALLAAVHRVRGVKDVQSALRVHDESGNVADLQLGSSGEEEREGRTTGSQLWSPTTRAAIGAAGFGLLATCLGRRTPTAKLLGAVGLALTSQAMSNRSVQRLLGLSHGRRGIDIRTGIVINAPIEQVFELLSTPENYARLTDVILSVENLGGDRYHKTVRLPGGAEVLLAEQIIAREKNECVCWRSEPESFVPYAGAAWFTALDDNRTEVQVTMSYNPPGGVLAHAAASIVHMNPRMLMDDFLMRAKQYCETGQQPRDAADKQPPTASGGRHHEHAQDQQPGQEGAPPRVEGASSPAQAGEPVIHSL